MASIWQRNPIKVKGQFIHFQCWKPDFDVHAANIPTKLVWIRFSDLPLEYWHKKILLSMAKGAGRHVAVDRRTRSAAMGNYARVQMEVVSGIKRVEEIQVERKQQGSGEVFLFKQRIIYEDGMTKCGFCIKIGHSLLQCREKKAPNARERRYHEGVAQGAATMEDLAGSGRHLVEGGGGMAVIPVAISGQIPSIRREDRDAVFRSQSREDVSHMERNQRMGNISVVLPLEMDSVMDKNKEGLDDNQNTAESEMDTNMGIGAGLEGGSIMDPVSDSGVAIEEVARWQEEEEMDESQGDFGRGRCDHHDSLDRGEGSGNNQMVSHPHVPRSYQQLIEGAMVVFHEDLEEVDRMACEREGDHDQRRQQKGKFAAVPEQASRKSDRLALLKR